MRYEQDDDLGPVVSKRDVPMPSNFVSPAPLATRQPQTIDAAPSWLVSRETLPIAGTWETGPGAKETTQRNRPRRGRAHTPNALRLAMGGRGRRARADGVPSRRQRARGGAGGCAGVRCAHWLHLLRLNRKTTHHSNGGVERLRITEASSLAREQMSHEQELRRMALDAYLRQLEARNDEPVPSLACSGICHYGFEGTRRDLERPPSRPARCKARIGDSAG